MIQGVLAIKRTDLSVSTFRDRYSYRIEEWQERIEHADLKDNLRRESATYIENGIKSTAKPTGAAPQISFPK